MPGWHPHADVWLLLGGLWVGYLVAWRRRAADVPPAREQRRRRTALFTVGMALLLLASDWPVHDLAEERLYSAHMVQHLVYTLVAAPLLLAGVPAWMWRALLRPSPVWAVFGFLTRPIVALAVFNGLLLLTHWPEVVNASVRSEWTHFGLHVLIVGSAVVMWWPVLSPLPERPPLSPPLQMVYLFLQSLAPTIPASFLTFGTSPLYAAYESFPRTWGLSALDDQLIAGLVMKIAGGLILWAFIAVIFFNWHARERTGWDALGLRQVERDVRARMAR
ncbi:MAG TPA: cytochrome c oxidase assembly protein [Actinomycetota bacterium]